MALTQVRRIDRIEVTYPNPALQVRYVEEIQDAEGAVVATVGYVRESYDITSDLSKAPIQVQAAAAAMAAFQQVNPNADDVVKVIE